MSQDARTQRTLLRWRTRLAMAALALAAVVYFGIYVWARTTGLFGWARMHAAYITPGHIRTIMPVGNMSIVVLPDEETPPEVQQQRVDALASRKRISKALWPFYSWLASVEAACRPGMTSTE